MILKRKHLLCGLAICITCLVVYIVFSIWGENILISIGNQIEKVTGPSAVMPSVPLEIIKTLTSGIFISTIVAMVFYNQEYLKLHEENIKQVIASSQKLADLYAQIPYLMDPDEDNSLIIGFFKERSRNNVIEERLELFDSITSKYRSEIEAEPDENAKNLIEQDISASRQKIEKEIVHEQENKYRESLIKNGVNPDIVDIQLEKCFSLLDEKVEKCRDIYMQILDYDMEELKSLCNGLDPFLEIKKPAEIDEETVWNDLGSSNNMSANMVAKRLFSMYERGKLVIRAPFGMDGHDIDTCAKEDLIVPVLFIQKHFLFKENMRLVLNDPNTVTPICYSKFNYTIAALHELLSFCTYRRKRKLSKFQFAKTNPNYRSFTLSSEDTEIIKNIYDKQTFSNEI